MSADSGLIIPAIMIGGAGSRLWPLSRADKPKQFLDLTGSGTLLETTLGRFKGEGFGRPWLLANRSTVALMSRLLPADAGIGGMVVEPSMRGTAAAIAAIASVLGRSDPDQLILVAPADHFIRNEAAFCDAVHSAAPLAEAGFIVTFGIEPTGPETGFGYISGGAPVVVDGKSPGRRVAPGDFHEKPDVETARRFVAQGYFWNAGIFLFKASVMLAELQKHAPETAAAVLGACDAGLETTIGSIHRIEPDADSFGRAPADLPIDIAVMERTDRVVVAPCRDIGWSDIGSLSALWQIADKDADGNAVSGDVMVHASRNLFVHSAGGRKIVAAHLADTMIVDMEDVLVVLPTSEAQAVKQIVSRLQASGAPQLRYYREAAFAWGSAHLEAAGPKHCALTLRIAAGQRIPERQVSAAFENWLVTDGIVSFQENGRTTILRVGQSLSLVAGQRMSLLAVEAAVVALTSAPLRAGNLANNFDPIEPVMATDAMVAANVDDDREVA